MPNRVEILNEVRLPPRPSGRRLCFQNCIYHYDNGDDPENGFRFIWRLENGNLQPARGQARIPTARHLRRLLELAENAGWLPADAPN